MLRIEKKTPCHRLFIILINDMWLGRIVNHTRLHQTQSVCLIFCYFIYNVSALVKKKINFIDFTFFGTMRRVIGTADLLPTPKCVHRIALLSTLLLLLRVVMSIINFNEIRKTKAWPIRQNIIVPTFDFIAVGKLDSPKALMKKIQISIETNSFRRHAYYNKILLCG